jgi:hypothetical protein
MPPQHPYIMVEVKSGSSGESSEEKFVHIASRKSSAAAGGATNRSDVSPSRAAEAWLSRRNSREPLSNAMNLCESPSISARVSLRERLQARMKDGKSPEPLHAEATLRLLTKGLTQMTSSPPPPPHSTPTSQVGRKSPRELDQYLQTETTEYDEIPQGRNAAPPPPRISARARPRKASALEEAKKKQKMAFASDAVARMMEAIHDKQQQQDTSSVDKESAALLRCSSSRTKRVEPNVPKENRIKLHIYDLLTNETYMQVGWGCEFPIGQCFNAMNNGLHALGTGAYHCGIEVCTFCASWCLHLLLVSLYVRLADLCSNLILSYLLPPFVNQINGIEYAYGANNSAGTTGVFSCIPKHSPGYEYRTTLDFGSRPLTKRAWVRVAEKDKDTSVYREVVTYIDGRQVVKEMAKEYLGSDYDLLRRNCCTFARDAALRLGIRQEEIPSWLLNLADAGAATQDTAAMALKPITSILSGIEDDLDSVVDTSREDVVEEAVDFETGFEVIAKTKEGQSPSLSIHEMEIVKVVEALGIEPKNTCAGVATKRRAMGYQRTCSWA